MLFLFIYDNTFVMFLVLILFFLFSYFYYILFVLLFFYSYYYHFILFSLLLFLYYLFIMMEFSLCFTGAVRLRYCSYWRLLEGSVCMPSIVTWIPKVPTLLAVWGQFVITRLWVWHSPILFLCFPLGLFPIRICSRINLTNTSSLTHWGDRDLAFVHPFLWFSLFLRGQFQTYIMLDFHFVTMQQYVICTQFQ